MEKCAPANLRYHRFYFLGEKKYFQKKLAGKFGDKFKSKIFRQGDKIYQQPNMQVFPGKK